MKVTPHQLFFEPDIDDYSVKEEGVFKYTHWTDIRDINSVTILPDAAGVLDGTSLLTVHKNKGVLYFVCPNQVYVFLFQC